MRLSQSDLRISTKPLLPLAIPDYPLEVPLTIGWIYAVWSVTSKPAMLALVKVLKAPAMSAESAKRLTSPAREGAIWDKTPICVPKDPMFAKPHRAYVAMRRDRKERSAYDGSVWRAV